MRSVSYPLIVTKKLKMDLMEKGKESLQLLEWKQTCKWLATFSLVKSGSFINSRILFGTAPEIQVQETIDLLNGNSCLKIVNKKNIYELDCAFMLIEIQSSHKRQNQKKWKEKISGESYCQAQVESQHWQTFHADLLTTLHGAS